MGMKKQATEWQGKGKPSKAQKAFIVAVRAMPPKKTKK